MKKGEIYEGVVERIDFPNKGRVHVEGETVTARSNRKIPDGKARSGLQYFPVLRRMHVPDDEL